MINMFSAEWETRDTYSLRPDARRFENWENAYALRAGLGVAARYATDIGLERIRDRVRMLASRLRAELVAIDGARVHDCGTEQSAIVSFTIEGLDPANAVQLLRERGVHIGSSRPSSTRLDAENRSLPVMLRRAPHYYNTEDEIDRVVEELVRIS